MHLTERAISHTKELSQFFIYEFVDNGSLI